MRHHASTLLTAFAATLLTASLAHAQSSAQHTVTVSIPTVLRLKIDGSTATDRRSIDVSIKGTDVTPNVVTVDVFANSAWTLTVTTATGDGPMLEYRRLWLGGDGWTSLDAPSVVDSEGPTGGWKAFDLGLRLADPASAPLDGVTRTRTVLFTLTRP